MNTQPPSLRSLHRTILLIVALVAGVLATVMIVEDAVDHARTHWGLFGAIILAVGTVLYAAVSSILVGLARDRRGVVFAHIATPIVIATLGALLAR